METIDIIERVPTICREHDYASNLNPLKHLWREAHFVHDYP